MHDTDERNKKKISPRSFYASGGDMIRQIQSDTGAHLELNRDGPQDAPERIFFITGLCLPIYENVDYVEMKWNVEVVVECCCDSSKPLRNLCRESFTRHIILPFSFFIFSQCRFVFPPLLQPPHPRHTRASGQGTRIHPAAARQRTAGSIRPTHSWVRLLFP